MKKLAIITTHPIQYNAPFFALLQKRDKIQIKVFYTWGTAVLHNKYDPGFAKNISWDIPLLEGYEHAFMHNISSSPGSHHFKGIDNPGLIKEIQAWEADAILVYGWAFKSHLSLIRYFHKKILVLFRGDSTLLDRQPAFKKIIRSIFLKWVYSYIDIAFYAGTANKDYFLAHGLKEEQLVWAPHTIDTERFFDKDGGYTTQAMEWRQRLGIPKEGIVFLFAGKLEPKKDPALLVEAFLQLHQPNIFLLITGNGPLEKTLKDKCAAVSNIFFIDFVNQLQMPVLYRLADIFVLPSRGPGETWGLAINEAMACSRPVLVSNKCGAAQDLVMPGLNGYIFEAGNADDLRVKMKDMIEHKIQLTKWGEVSFTRIREWRMEIYCNRLENAVEAKTVRFQKAVYQ